jgi:prepilin-type N-terminal cleavage/methylation domain-containing protein
MYCVTKNYRKAFTLIELLLVIGIIATLASIVILSVNPRRQLAQANDAKRANAVKQLQSALTQYLIDNGSLPTSVSATETRAICRQGVTSNACANLDALVPTYIAQLPQDSDETNTNFSGYKVYVYNLRPTVSSVYQGVITTGLVAQWRFNGTGGTATALIDSSGNGYNGTFAGTETSDWVLDSPRLSKSSGSFTFSDSGDTSTLSTEAPLGFAWTVTVWFKTPFSPIDGAWHTLLRGSATDHQVILGYTDHHLGMYANTGGGFFDSGYNPDTLSAGWHHLAAVGQGSTTSFYIDGSLVGSVPYRSTAAVYSIGNYQGGGQPWGQMSDMRVYSRVLTPTEIGLIATGGG